VLAFLAALVAASNPAPVILDASTPWWERISVTVDGNGKQQSCTYQSSFSMLGPEACDEEMASSITATGAKGPSGVFSKLTFERRFSPGPKLDTAKLQPGDKLLGQQVMHLIIDADGSIQSCSVVGSSGLRPAYGCEQAKEEQFRVPASSPSAAPRQAFMTIIAYGHQEQIA
jgi:hypothetical protein